MGFIKHLKKLLSILIICMMIISTNVYAYSNNNYSQAKSAAENFLNEKGIKAKLNNPIELYSFNNKIEFLFFSNKNSGYIIVDLKDYSIPEFSPDSDNKLIVDKNKKYFYNGPLAYFEEVNNKVIDINTKRNIGTIKELKCKNKVKKSNTDSNLYSKNICSNKITKASSSTYKDHFISGTLPNYSYNPNGICGSVAAAMLARYFNNYINGKYVPSNLETSDGVALIKEFVPYIEGEEYLDPSIDSNGSSTEKLRSGIENYLRAQSVSDNMYSQTSTNYSRVSERVSKNRPFIVDLDNQPKYGEHWVTAHGYTTKDSTFISKLVYIVVNDGWGSTNIYIDVTYCDDLVW